MVIFELSNHMPGYLLGPPIILRLKLAKLLGSIMFVIGIILGLQLVVKVLGIGYSLMFGKIILIFTKIPQVLMTLLHLNNTSNLYHDSVLSLKSIEKKAAFQNMLVLYLDYLASQTAP